MITVLIIIVCVLLVTTAISYYELGRSVEIDPKQPFLRGDYDENNDPTIKHQRVFCANCKFFDGCSVCLNGNVAEVGDERVEHCKKNSMFTPN